MKEEDLSTSLTALDKLWDRVDRVRSTSTTVTVSKEALTGVLLDHTRMAAELFHQKYRRVAT